jgi:adenosylmethionine---8-amino-7-oxononanoate aminotransferase
VTPEERAELVRRDKDFVWHPYTQMEHYRAEVDPLVIERASGSRIFDADGRSILDGNASWWTSLLGHNHPRLVAALTKQAASLCHTSLAGITHEPAVMFSEALVRVAPIGLRHAFFSDNGSTAVESALKMAAQFFHQSASGPRHKFLSLSHAFHGETLGVTALGGVEAFRSPFGPLTMPCHHLPSPSDGLEEAVTALSQILEREASDICALVIEPLIQGAGGMRMYDPAYLREARRLTKQHDVLLVVDEVFTGYGRTGKFWACDHADISPDILCTAKGLSGGVLPFAATLTTDRVFEAFLGGASRAFLYGHTYCGNPLGAAVALEVLKVYADEEVMAGIPERSLLIEKTFRRLSALDGVVDARSLGMCGALDLAGGRGYLERGGWKVYERALQRGAYVRPLGNVVYVTPALNIPLADLEELLFIVERSVRDVVECV